MLQKRVGLWVALQLFLFCEGIAKRLCRKLHCRSVYVCRLMVALSGFRVADNVLQLPEGGDFEALHCQPSTNFDRSTKLDLTTEPPLLGRCCYAQFFFSRQVVYVVLKYKISVIVQILLSILWIYSQVVFSVWIYVKSFPCV